LNRIGDFIFIWKKKCLEKKWENNFNAKFGLTFLWYLKYIFYKQFFVFIRWLKKHENVIYDGNWMNKIDFHVYKQCFIFENCLVRRLQNCCNRIIKIYEQKLMNCSFLYDCLLCSWIEGEVVDWFFDWQKILNWWVFG